LRCQGAIKQFLTDFYSDAPEGGKSFSYAKQLKSLAQRETISLLIDLSDVAATDQDLCDAIVDNSKRYEKIFADVIQELLPEYKDKEVNQATATDVV
jgi:DNA replication licensing factor MCM7